MEPNYETLVVTLRFPLGTLQWLHEHGEIARATPSQLISGCVMLAREKSGGLPQDPPPSLTIVK